MKLKIISDLKVAEEFIKNDPEAWDRVSEDGNKKEDFIITENPYFWWVGCYAKGKGMVGLFWLHHINNTTIQIHINVKKEHREKYAYECGESILKFFQKELKGYDKIIAEIPVIYPDVYYYAKKFGFVDEGVNRASYKKNNKIIDQYRLGITRSEVNKWV